MEKYKYIKTRVNGDVVIMRMDTCNLCPFLNFDKTKKIATCAEYKNIFRNGDTLISDNIITKNIKSYIYMCMISRPLQDIPIPTWCGLRETDMLANHEIDVFFKKGENKYGKSCCLLTNRVVLSSDRIKYNSNFKDLVIKDGKNINKKTQIFEKKENLFKCSFCGVDKKNIDRNKKVGMCTECYETYKFDKSKKYFAYINNFRLKRNTDWTDKINKQVNINI